MYTNEKIQKMLDMMEAEKERLEKIGPENLKMCISSGNSKIGKALNVSLPPVLCCHNCAACKYLCYDIKACLRYPQTVINARMRNYVILMHDRDRFFADIDKAMASRRKNKFLRFHVAGDLPDIDYFDRMVQLARKHPDFIVWTYTKCYGFVNSWCQKHGKDAIPNNLKVMFSEWRGMPMHNPFAFPEFKVVFKDETPPSGFYCPGNCDACKNPCQGCIAGKTVYCREH